MKLFDENLKEIFLYQYTEGQYEIDFQTMLFSYRQISAEEWNKAYEEHNALRKKFNLSLEKALRDSGLQDARDRHNSKNRPSIEESTEIMNRYYEEYSKVPRVPERVDFLCEKFGLKLFEGYEAL